MKIIKAVDRLDAIAKNPKAIIVRRVSEGVYETFNTKDDYCEHLLSIGKKVDKRWLKKRGALPGFQ